MKYYEIVFQPVLDIGYETFIPEPPAGLYERLLRNYAGTARPVPPEDRALLPRLMRYNTDSGKLPDVLTALANFLVSDRVKAIIERLEPGLHEFLPLPVELTNEGGDKLGTFPYFVVSLDDVHDFLDLEKSSIATRKQLDGRPYQVLKYGQGGGVVMLEHKVAGRHIWRAGSGPAGARKYCSLVFRDAIEAADIVGFKFYPCEP